MSAGYNGLTIALAVITALNLVVLSTQSRLDRSHPSLRLWTLGTALWAAAFFAGCFRSYDIVRHAAIAANSALFTCGLAVFFVGVLRFLGLREHKRILFAVCAAATIAIVWTSFFHDLPAIRRLAFGAAHATISFMAAFALFSHRAHSGHAAAFVASICSFSGVFYLGRALLSLPSTPGHGVQGWAPIHDLTYLVTLAICTMLNAGVIMMVNERLHAERQATIESLRAAAEEIQTLSGIIPICASCKSIRNDAGYWEQVEAYVSRRTAAQFSHGICAACAIRLYPGLKVPDTDTPAAQS